MLFSSRGPLPAKVWSDIKHNSRADAGLLCSLGEEQNYHPDIEGKIPPGLRGSLYRNGPGKFDRGGLRKRMMLDGDGLVQAFHFGDKGVQYVARFPRTAKFVEEEKRGKFCYPTWSTLAPGWSLRNVGGKIPSQAGVTVFRAGDCVLAFDESQPPFAMDAQTLASVGDFPLSSEGPLISVQAHWKWDVRGQGWATLSFDFGKEITATVRSFKKGETKVFHTQRMSVPRGVYIHDWFLTESHVVLLLHPAFVSLRTFAKAWLGLRTFAESIEWRPDMGNVVLVVSRNGGEAKLFEAPAEYMWHSVNGFEAGDEIILDFVGNRNGGGLGSENSPFFQLMRGENPVLPKVPCDRLVRYGLNLKTNRCKVESLLDSADYEMPYIRTEERAVRHGDVFLAESNLGEIFWSAIVRREESGKTDRYHFGNQVYCTEPVWAFDPLEKAGWILTEVYDPKRQKSRLDILKADALSQGPVGSVLLRHHVPLSFHGVFHPNH